MQSSKGPEALFLISKERVRAGPLVGRAGAAEQTVLPALRSCAAQLSFLPPRPAPHMKPSVKAQIDTEIVVNCFKLAERERERLFVQNVAKIARQRPARLFSS